MRPLERHTQITIVANQDTMSQTLVASMISTTEIIDNSHESPQFETKNSFKRSSFNPNRYSVFALWTLATAIEEDPIDELAQCLTRFSLNIHI